jgi:hypothetical protein
MKKKVYGIITLALLVAVSAVNVKFMNDDSNLISYSSLTLKRLEAMTRESGTEWGCGGHVTYIKNQSLKSLPCTVFGTERYLICQFTKDVCCDPSGQTSCQ